MSRWLKDWVAFVLAAAAFSAATVRGEEQRVEFNRDIRPILSENCFLCHGMDAAARKAGLRLDIEESSRAVIVPGQPDRSELIRRVFDPDPGERMPPPESHRSLSGAERELLRQWVLQGAPYEPHWAFQPPRRPPLPEVRAKHWPRNGIDYFVLQRLEADNLQPSPPAPPRPLLRRVALDLTGLPPAPSDLDRWLAEEDALSTAVDELLASPRFGERMASDWMDVARYADTHGFNNDSMRSMWRWRDWVIEAFNRNLPYHRFIEEQLAGDLLPAPSLDQLIATGFNRNHVINSEGGIIGEEYRVEYVADRVRTVSLAWLGLTLDCARCHDHKFDPVSQREYFQFFAFFNTLDEHGEAGRLSNAAPLIAAPTAEQQRAQARQEEEIRKLEKEMARWMAKAPAVRFEHLELPEATASVAETNRLIQFDLPSGLSGEEAANLAGGKPFRSNHPIATDTGPSGQVALLLDGEADLRSEGLPRAARHWAFSVWARRDQAAEGPLFSTMNFELPRSFERYGRGVEIRFDEGGAVEVRLVNCWPSYSLTVRTRERVAPGEWRHVLVVSDGSAKPSGLRIFLDGEEAFRELLHEDFGDANISGRARIGSSGQEGSRKFAGALADYRLIAEPEVEEIVREVRAEVLRFSAVRLAEAEAGTAAELLRPPIEDRSPELVRAAQRLAWTGLAARDSGFAGLLGAWRAAREELLALERSAPTLMVAREMSEPRTTHVLLRGEYDKPREQVEPDVPALLPPFLEGEPRNRLGLARWLTAPDHPLTPRVVVNRFWQSLFGTGLVKSSEDFGHQGDWPSHPELLDWLAVEFAGNGWDVKELIRMLVTSATYRQDSSSSPELNELDPENRLLARGPRQRLTAEMLRDQALAVSGLLEERAGGPPVYPYQPPNLYRGIVVAADYPGTQYIESEGPDLYRRGLYTFWKRTVPHPSLTTFDAPDREFCVARRLKTNTPLQALALMNDIIQLEAARKLAEQLLTGAGSSPAARIRSAFSSVTARVPEPEELEVLESFLERRLSHYRSNPEAAEAFLTVGASPRDERLDPAEVAAYANLTSLLLNLDETIHRN